MSSTCRDAQNDQNSALHKSESETATLSLTFGAYMN